jgi:hypothetical protein
VVDRENLANNGAQVGGFTLPWLGGLIKSSRRLRTNGGPFFSTRPRRLDEVCDPVLQNTKWSSNPFAYAGNVSNGSAPSNVMGAGTKSSCCALEVKSEQSMDVKACGNRVEIANLAEPIVFQLASSPPGVANDTNPFRLCQFFDELSGTWSSEGCRAPSGDAYSITCACNHLSSFIAAAGAFVSLLLSSIECSNADVLTPAAVKRHSPT